MRKVTIILFIAALLLCTGGCADIDWKAKTKAAFAALLELTMKVVVDQFGDDKLGAVTAVVRWVEGPNCAWAWPVIKWIDYEGLVEHTYDRVHRSWYRMLRAAHYDTDAYIARESKVFALMDIPCPGLQDELVAMME